MSSLEDMLKDQAKASSEREKEAAAKERAEKKKKEELEAVIRQAVTEGVDEFLPLAEKYHTRTQTITIPRRRFLGLGKSTKQIQVWSMPYGYVDAKKNYYSNSQMNRLLGMDLSHVCTREEIINGYYSIMYNSFVLGKDITKTTPQAVKQHIQEIFVSFLSKKCNKS